MQHLGAGLSSLGAFPSRTRNQWQQRLPPFQQRTLICSTSASSVVEAGSSAKGEKPTVVGGGCGSQNFVTRQDCQLKSIIDGSGTSPYKDLDYSNERSSQQGFGNVAKRRDGDLRSSLVEGAEGRARSSRV